MSFSPIGSMNDGFAFGRGIRQSLAESALRRRAEEATEAYRNKEIDEAELERRLQEDTWLTRGQSLTPTRDALRTETFDYRNRDDSRRGATAIMEGNFGDAYGAKGSIAARTGDMAGAQTANEGLVGATAIADNLNPDGTPNISATRRQMSQVMGKQGNLGGAEMNYEKFRELSGAEFARQGGQALFLYEMGKDAEGDQALTAGLSALGVPNLYARINPENREEIAFTEILPDGTQRTLSQVVGIEDFAQLLQSGQDVAQIAPTILKQLDMTRQAAVASAKEDQDFLRAVFKDTAPKFMEQAMERYGAGGAAFARLNAAAAEAGLKQGRQLSDGTLEYITAAGEPVFVRFPEETEDGTPMGALKVTVTDLNGNAVDPAKVLGAGVASAIRAAEVDAAQSADFAAQFAQAQRAWQTVLTAAEDRVAPRGAGRGEAAGPAGRAFSDGEAAIDPVASLEANLGRPLSEAERRRVTTPGAEFNFSRAATPEEQGAAPAPAPTAQAPAPAPPPAAQTPARPSGRSEQAVAFQNELDAIAAKERTVQAQVERAMRMVPQVRASGFGGAPPPPLPDDVRRILTQARPILADLAAQRKALQGALQEEMRKSNLAARGAAFSNMEALLRGEEQP